MIFSDTLSSAERNIIIDSRPGNDDTSIADSTGFSGDAFGGGGAE